MSKSRDAADQINRVNSSAANATAITIDANENVNFSANATFGDNDKAIFGAGSDLEIYHDGTHSYINDVGTGPLRITSDGTGILLNKSTTESMGRFLTDGAVELYYDSAKKFETTSIGCDITGTLTSDGLTLGANNANSPQILFENSDGVTGDAALSTYDDSLGTMLVMGSNFYINSSGSESRFNTSEESSAVMLNRNGELNLMTGGTGATASTRLKIDSSGNVGIGNSSPNTKLDVIGSSTNGSGVVDTIRLRNNGTSANDGPRLQFTSGTSTSGAAIASQGKALNSADLVFYAGGNTERMRISSTGVISGNGSGLTGVGASTTLGAVGTYGLLRTFSGGPNNPGSTLSGGSLKWVPGQQSAYYYNASPSGTWRCMGFSDFSAYGEAGSNTIWVRIS